MGNYIYDILVAVAFVAAVMFVGLWKSKGEETHGDKGAEDYFLAGRGLSWWLIGFSLIAANISAEQFVGMSGQGAGVYGLSVASWEWIAAITLFVVAFALLPYFLKSGITTIPEFLEVRYNHWARLAMTLSMTGILIAASLIGVIYAGALTLTELCKDLGIALNMTGCCWALGIMAAIYVAVGGLKACAWADLLQGSALILGGGVIAYYAFAALADPGSVNIASEAIVTSTGSSADLAAGASASFSSLNESAMHMNTPAMPWPILILGIWIPNFYYWGLNQYITQRILGSGSLAEGQKGLVLAAGLKLIIPFIIVIPGIIAFNLFSGDMEKAANDAVKDGTVFTAYQEATKDATSKTIFKLDEKYAVANPAKAAEITAYNATVVARVGKDEVKEEEINPYKYDSAMGLLITKLIPKNKGILGFVIAALLGAIISSLAAVLNAISTLLTMDVYQRYIKPDATQFQYVTMGRIFIGVFVVVGCVIAPMITSASIFGTIQWLQGFASIGILAAFVYGLLNRTSGQWAGLIAIAVNAVLYGLLDIFYSEVNMLYRMSYCFLAVLAVLFVYGLVCKADKKVVFESNTTLDMTPSKGAFGWGIIVCIATVALYIIFW